MTDADTLRRAAALVRERAAQATPGPWRFTDSEVVNDVWTGGMVVVNADGEAIANLQDDWYHNDDPADTSPMDDAAHIAGMHPGVALALADWLDRMATDPALDCQAEALRVARTILGDTP